MLYNMQPHRAGIMQPYTIAEISLYSVRVARAREKSQGDICWLGERRVVDGRRISVVSSQFPVLS